MNLTSQSSEADNAIPEQFEQASWIALRKRLIRHARMVVHDPALAEDLAQETLINVLENQPTLRGEASLTTWATAILKNKIADWYRSPHQRRRIYNTHGEGEDQANPTDGTFNEQGGYLEPVDAWQQPEGREAQRQIMSTLESCLRCLPVQTGRVFMMREWLGFETPEICMRLGLTADNCRMVLHRARMGLRQCMTSRGHTIRDVS